MADETYLEAWYLALRSKAGVCLRITGDVRAARQKLYRARAESLDPDLEALSVVESPSAGDELWIVHRQSAQAAPPLLNLSDIKL